MDHLPDLPIEIWKMILLEDFELEELMKMKYVCKKFNQIINFFEFEEIVIGHLKSESQFWYYTNKKLKRDSIVCPCRLDFFDQLNKNSSFANHFNKLKTFKIGLTYNFDLNKFNQLNKLEHLELDSDLWLKEETTLNLPNLKIFKIRIRSNSKLLIIDSFKLSIICSLHLERIQIKRPETVKEITLSMNKNENLKKFLNLEILRYQNQNELDVESLPDLLPLKLKQIHFYLVRDSETRRKMDTYKNKIYSFLAKIKSIPIKDLKVYFECVELELELENKIPTELFLTQPNYHLISNYFNKLEENVRGCELICFAQLLMAFNQRIPDDFFKKFTMVKTIVIRVRLDQDKLIEFISKNTNLEEIYIYHNNFNQEFFDKLPDYCPQLIFFNWDVNDADNSLNFDLNFNFFLKFKNLVKISITKFINLELIFKIFENSKVFYSIAFTHNEDKIVIQKPNNKKPFSFSLEYGESEWSKLKPEELIEIFDLIM